MPRGSPPLGYSKERDSEVLRKMSNHPRNMGPPQEVSGGGSSYGQLRLRPGRFGSTIVEELVYNHDGTREWKKISRSIVIPSMSEADWLVVLLNKVAENQVTPPPADEHEDMMDRCRRAAADDMYVALRELMMEKIDYMKINNLGDPEKTHTIKMARTALRKAEGRSNEER